MGVMTKPVTANPAALDTNQITLQGEKIEHVEALPTGQPAAEAHSTVFAGGNSANLSAAVGVSQAESNVAASPTPSPEQEKVAPKACDYPTSEAWKQARQVYNESVGPSEKLGDSICTSWPKPSQ